MTPDTLGYLLFTSGTSGAPKACLCSQGRLARIGAIVAQMYALTPEDVCYLSMPLFHSNALMAGWGPALMAGSAFALPVGGRFSASGFLPDVRAAGATYFNYVGKPLSYILATPEQPDDADNPLRPRLRQRGVGRRRGPLRRALRGGRHRLLRVDRGRRHGGRARPTRQPGALGRAPEGTVVLDPATGAECPPARFDDQGRLLNAEEAIGELVSKGGGAGFEGYWRNDDAERSRLREGWYWTGDLAYRDDAGFFYFAGRDHDWLRVDGENFASAPIERILQRHPDVVLAAVYAVPDPVVGDQVMAARAAAARPATPRRRPSWPSSWPRRATSGTKWAPRFVRMSPALPITATNKVLKRALRAERWNCAEPVLWQPRQGGPTCCSTRPRRPRSRRRWATGSSDGDGSPLRRHRARVHRAAPPRSSTGPPHLVGRGHGRARPQRRRRDRFLRGGWGGTMLGGGRAVGRHGGPAARRCCARRPGHGRAPAVRRRQLRRRARPCSTVHHWHDLAAGLQELRRVARRQVVMTIDTDVHDELWLFREYVPAIVGMSAASPLPAVVEGLGAHTVETLPIPADCSDGFVMAYWRRPEQFLDPVARANTSAFARLDPADYLPGLAHLERDLADGSWVARHGDLLGRPEHDAGLRLVTAG